MSDKIHVFISSGHHRDWKKIHESLVATYPEKLVVVPSVRDGELEKGWAKVFEAGKLRMAGKERTRFISMLLAVFRPWIELSKVFRRGRRGPPKGFLIDLLVPADRAEDMLSGLQTAYEERWVPKYGARRARRIFMTQSIGSILGFWIDWMMKHLRLLKFFAS
ncbi:MAG TPA: hypothetical protein VNZ53_33100 [Steroidobacteraceae bacterium]|jgi:hypothetical protein|nr:hypothetical protein [Steroidobacteraceae bacterium]